MHRCKGNDNRGRQNDIGGGNLLESSFLLKTKHRIRLRFVKVKGFFLTPMKRCWYKVPQLWHPCVVAFPKRSYFVYIVASLSGTLYTGVTNNLPRRIFEHKQRTVEGFAKTYGCDRLIHYEAFHDVSKAIEREKEIKGWKRSKKQVLVKTSNPDWKDLSREWF